MSKKVKKVEQLEPGDKRVSIKAVVSITKTQDQVNVEWSDGTTDSFDRRSDPAIEVEE